MTQMIGEFKETEIGQIPIEWALTELSELATRFHGGGTPSTKKPEYWNGSIPWTTSAHIGDQIFLDKFAGKITAEGVKKSSTQVVPKQNLLIGTRVGVGKVAINLLDTAISQDLTAMIVDKSKVDLLFLAYAISWDITQRTILSGARGTTIKGIPRADLVKVSIPLPPLDEQRRIAAVLTAIQDAIAAQEDVIAAARAFKRSLMHRLFTYGPGRVPAETKETEIGEIPVHWEVVELGQIAHIQSGSTPSRKHSEYYVNGTIPWVKTLDLNEGLVSSTHESITQDALTAIRGRLRPSGTVMVAMYGGSGTIGKSGILGIEAATNQAVCCIEPNPRIFDSVYLHQYIVKLRPLWMKYAIGTRKDPNISKTIVVNQLVPLAPTDEQQVIARWLSSAEAKIAAEEDRKAALDTLFKSMLHQLMTGQIRLMSDEGLPLEAARAIQ